MRVFNATSRTRVITALFVFAALFTTQWVSAQCTATPFGGPYPGATFTPACPSAATSVGAADCWAGEYSNVNLSTTGNYTFSSSTATDYITIMDATGTTALAWGTSPVNFTPASNGTYRFATHTNIACGSASVNRTRRVACALAANCTGTPSPGNTIASASPVCASELLTLSLQNSTPGLGISYQWYEANATSGWAYNPVGGSTNTYVTVISEDTDFFCEVTCSFSGQTGSSLPVSVIAETDFSACYCDAGANNEWEYIDNVTMNNVNNTSGAWGAGGYEDYTALTVNVAQTASYPITVTLGNGYFADAVNVWIDLDHSGAFDALELLYASSSGQGPHVGNITIPGTALLGDTQMRIRLYDGTDGTGPYVACANNAYGEVEDYTVNIATAPSCLTPTIVSVTEDPIAFASVDIAYTDGGPGYQISYGPHPTAAGAGTIVSSGSSPATIGGLTNGLDYDFYIRQNCGGLDGDSDWSPVYTHMNYITVGNSGTESYTTCGGIITDAGGLLGNYQSGTTGMVVLTPANPTDIIRFQGNVDFEGGVDGIYFFEGVGIGGVQIDGYTGTSPPPIDVLSVGAGQPVTVYIQTSAFTNFSGMALTLSCQVAPTCIAPTLVFATNVDTDSADISWNCTGGCTGPYIVEYGPLGFTPGIDANPGVGGTVVTSPTSPLTLTGLPSGTDFDVYVRQDCGAGDYSTNSVFVVSFSTAAPPNCGAGPVYNCGTNQNLTLAGPGAWLLTEPLIGFTTFGDEEVYRFTPPTTGSYTLQVTSSTDFIEPFAYYFKDPAMGCDDQNWTHILTATFIFGVPTQANFGILTGGQEYWLLVDATETVSTTQQFNISCTPIVPPANDLCAGALPVGCGGTVTGSTANATNDNMVSECFIPAAQTAPGVWYSIIGNGGTYTLDLSASVYDTKVAVYSGTCGSLNCVAGDDDGGVGLTSLVSFDTNPSEVYYILVHGYNSSEFGNYDMAVTCVNPPAFDSPAGAIVIPYAGNAYPTCGVMTGTTVGCLDSPQDGNVGADCWYRFTAQSSGVAIRQNGPTMDDVISLFDSGLNPVAVEDVGIFGGDIEQMNVGGLIPGNDYYICVSNYDEFFGTPGPFTLCLRHLRMSSCDDGPGAYDLCTNFKADYTGAASYQFNFTNTNTLATTSASAAAQVPLSSTGLNLEHGEFYDVTVDGTFNLFDGNGTPEQIVIPGTAVCPISIAAHADLRTKAAQRCPATVLKGTTLQAKPFICAAVNHTITFQEVTDCTGLTTVGPTFTSTTSGSSPTKKLSQVGGVQSGKWYAVYWTPNFFYGAGAPGTVDIIQVAGSTQPENMGDVAQDNGKEDELTIEANLYPNPNTGDMVNLNIANVVTDNVYVRIIDGLGRVVYNNMYVVDGSLNTIVTFNNPLANGLYLVEFTVDGQVITEKMTVQK